MWTSKTAGLVVDRLKAEVEQWRSTAEEWRTAAEEARRVAAGFEGEANALRRALDLLRQIQAEQRIGETNAQLSTRVAELEAQLSQCLVRATTQPVAARDGNSRG